MAVIQILFISIHIKRNYDCQPFTLPFNFQNSLNKLNSSIRNGAVRLSKSMLQHRKLFARIQTKTLYIFPWFICHLWWYVIESNFYTPLRTIINHVLAEPLFEIALYFSAQQETDTKQRLETKGRKLHRRLKSFW